MPVNEFGQPVGDPVDWSPGPQLVPVTLTGRTCRLEPLGEQHVDGLYDALCVDSPPSTWTYMPRGPFDDRAEFADHVAQLQSTPAMVPLAIVLPDGRPAGIATYLRIDHANGTAEVGYITYGSVLQRTTAATEAMYLMAAHAFDTIGVRRYEWKCNALNAASRSRRGPPGVHLRGDLPPGDGRQGPQPGHRVVRDHRRRVAAAARRVRGLAGARRTSTTRDDSAAACRTCPEAESRGPRDRPWDQFRGRLSTSARLPDRPVQVQEQRLHRCDPEVV